MSPLLGAVGDSSEYAFRGNLDDTPNNFTLPSILNAEPGVAHTTGPILITGINNKVKISVSAGASVAVNSGIFTSGPAFIRNNESFAIKVSTTSGSDSDFLKSYSTTVTVGKKTENWTIKTRAKDITPNPFSFATQSNLELGVLTSSNVITLSGLETTVPCQATITSGIGSFRKNGGSPSIADTVTNGDTIQIIQFAATNYSVTNTTSILVGDYTASYSCSTRQSDTTVNQFTFTDFVNIGVSSSYTSNSITLTGADINTDSAPVPLTATISGGFLRVQRGVDGGGNPIYVRDFSATPSTYTVYNGDILTLRVNSSSNYSTSTSAVLSVTGANTVTPVTESFTVTTRPPISDTIPKQFSIIDKVDQARNISIISDPIVLTEMTVNPTGVATAYLSNNADGAQFRVTRNGSVVRDFSSNSYSVLNGDSIDLRITSSPASNGTVSTRFNIDGIDNTDINNIIGPVTISDSWVVRSAERKCPLTSPTLTNVTESEPSTIRSISFTPTGYDTDCNVVVNTSNPNSYLSVNGVTGNNLIVSPGTVCTVYMTSGTFSETRTTTITLTASNNVPTPTSVSSTWSVTTRAITTPTVTLSANPTSLSCGQNTTLTWTSTKAVIASTDGFVGGGTTSGSVSVGPVKKNSTYSVTVTGIDNTSATASASVNVTTSASASLSASSTSLPYKGSVTLTWSSSNASSVVTNFGVTSTSGSITLSNLTSTQTYTIYAVSNNECENSSQVSVTVNVASCEKTTVTDTYTSGVSINYTYANAGFGYYYHFTGLSGYALDSASRQATSTTGSQVWDGSGLSGGDALSWQIPSGVTSIYGIARGAGGGGGSGGPSLPGGGGGGGGEAFGQFSVTPGDYLIIRYGRGGNSPGINAAGNTPNNGGQGSFAEQGAGGVIQTSAGGDILRGRGGLGGGRNIGGLGGGNAGSDGYRTMLSNVNNTGNGGAPAGSNGQVTSGGQSYRRGGDGGQRSQLGQQGQGAYVYLAWNINIEGVSWRTLINGINDQYKSSFNRPATDLEIDYWVAEYINYDYDTLSQMQSAISSTGAQRSATGAIDECGDSL